MPSDGKPQDFCDYYYMAIRQLVSFLENFVVCENLNFSLSEYVNYKIMIDYVHHFSDESLNIS